MKKIILKTTALLIALAGLFASCSLFEDDDDDSPIGLIVAPAFNKAVLSLSVAGEGAARTALPSVSSAQEFESFDFEANKGIDRITKSWTGDSEKTAYAKMTSESFEMDAGTWTFTLTAKKGGMTYKGSVEKEITVGANSIEFTLSLAELSNEGKGSVEIKLSVPETVIAVTATLCNTSENEVSDSSITQSTDLTNAIVSYSAQNVPSGTYIVVFNLYADTSKTLLLGKWREYAGITNDVTSKSEIAIAEDDLDKVYTITYELNGGTLKGNWSGSYTRYNIDSQIPTADSVISNEKIFDGWYCDKDFSELFTKENVKGENVTLYAKWRNYKASEVAPAINNGTLSKSANLVLEGEITSDQLRKIASAMESKWCYLSLDLSKTTGLESIGKEFMDCRALKGIVIPNTVTSIGDDAFYGCSSLESVTISEGVTSIGLRAFYWCSRLENVTIPEGVTSIGPWAFKQCSRLESVTISEGVTSIGEYAFDGCSRLESVTIPGSVTSIGEYAFDECSELKSVYYNGSIEKWLKVIFSGSTANPCWNGADLYIQGNKLTELVIPDGVTSIGDKAFYGCSSLESVTISSSMTSIGKYAFYKCYALKSVTISEDVTSIGKYAFDGCSELKSVYYNGSIEKWLKVIFSGDAANPCWNGADLYIQGNKLTDLVIPNDMPHIEKYLFSGCRSLESVTIPDTVKSIGYYAFKNCNGIKKLSVTSVKKYTEIDFSTDANPCSNGAYLYINDELMPEDFVIPSDITSIPENAFRGIPNFKTVIIPDTVKSIGEGAFAGCSSLESLTIPFVGKSENDNEVFGYIFGTSEYSGGYKDEISYMEYTVDPPIRFRWGIYYIPSSLRSVTVTGGKYIPYNAFAGCKKIKTINLPVSVTEIGSNVFDGCLDLEKITIPFIGKSKTATGTDAVLGYLFGSENYIGGTCIEQAGKKYYISSSLGEVIILQGATTISEEAFFDCKMLTSVTVPSGVTSIGDKAFLGCSGLTSVTIPSGVTSIGFDAFSGCSNLAGNLTIPDSVTSIGKWSFSGCKGIDLITVGNGVTCIPEYAFYDCQAVKIGGAVEECYRAFNSSLKKLYVDSWTQYWKIGFSGRGFSGIVSEDLYDLYINEKLVGGSYTIPAYVTEIPEQGFANMRKLTEITVPSTVKKIGKYAFGNCANLKKAYISSVTTMGESIFKGCSSLNSVTLPLGNSSNDVGNRNRLAYFFNDFEKDGYVEIQCWDATYYIPSSLKSVTINSKSIPDYAFAFCTSISKIIIDSSVTSIGEYAFYECSGLKEVNYRGYRSQWGDIHIDSDGNEAFKKVTRTYNYTGE